MLIVRTYSQQQRQSPHPLCISVSTISFLRTHCKNPEAQQEENNFCFSRIQGESEACGDRTGPFPLQQRFIFSRAESTKQEICWKLSYWRQPLLSSWQYIFLHRIKAVHIMKLVSASDLRFFFAELKLVHRMDLESQWSRMSSHMYRVWSPSGFRCLGIVPMSQASLSSINVWSCKLWESFHLQHGSLRIGERDGDEAQQQKRLIRYNHSIFILFPFESLSNFDSHLAGYTRSTIGSCLYEFAWIC
jgi:hypothetical protein